MVRRSRIAALVLLGLALSVPPSLQAQCSKRIRVYLDISGSMDPRGKTPDSPFRQSVQSLRLLLEQRNFLEQNDVVEVVLFGDQIEGRYTAKGPAEILKQVDDLSHFNGLEQWTDFDKLFEDLDRFFSEKSDFNRQVVIIASDFFHEPGANMDYLRSWSAAYSKWAPLLRPRLAEADRQAVLLFKAPVKGAPGSEVQQRALADLSTLLGAEKSQEKPIYDVGKGGVGAAVLASKIRGRLIIPPTVTGRLDPATRKDLAITVENTNCFPIQIERVELKCLTGAENGETDPAPRFPKAGEEEIDANSSRAIVVSRPSGSCWDRDSDFAATAITPEGVRASSTGTTGTFLEIFPKQAFLESNLLGSNVLRLEADMTGLYAGKKQVEIALQSVDAGNAVHDVVEGTFEAPESLDPKQKRSYRIVFPVRDSIKDRLNNGEKLKVLILDGLSEAQEVTLYKDDLRSFTNALANFTSLLSCMFVGAAVFYRRKVGMQPFEVAANAASLASWLIGVVVLVGPFLIILARVLLLQALPFTFMDFLKTGSTVLAAGAAGFLVIRNLQRAKLIKQVYGDPPISVELYERRIRSGWLAWMVSALIASLMLLSILFFGLREEGGADNFRPQRIPLIETT